MSEVRYRGLLRRIHNERMAYLFEPGFMPFAGAVLASPIPLVTQLRAIIARDDPQMNRHAVTVAHMLRIHALAPDLIHMFKTVDAFEGQSLKHAILLALGVSSHEQVHAFLLAIFQDPGNISYRITAAEILKNAKKQPDMVLPFLHMAENTQENVELRCYAIEGILHHGGARILPLLVPFLQDQSGKVRWITLYGFDRLGHDLYASCIKPLINDTYKRDELVSVGILAKSLLRRWGFEETNQN